MRLTRLLTGVLFCSQLAAVAEPDVIIRGGTIYDGSGKPAFVADVAMKGDRIVEIGDLKKAHAKTEIDAKGLAVAPGFINMLSWAGMKLIHDGRSQSDIRQGVTLEVMGEGESMGPLSKAMQKELRKGQGDIKFPVEWKTLGEGCEWLEHHGVSCNFASFVGAATVRQHELGEVDRAPTPAELVRMKKLVAQAMEEGAVGVSSALIYAPGVYAKTDELIELARVASKYDGLYASHMRSEGNRFLEAIDELITICREAKLRSEIYHLKAAGQSNWPKLDDAIKKIEDARASGLKISADMYNYTAAATGLDAIMPPWVHEGGFGKWVERMKEPATRARLLKEISTPSNEWENFYLAAGSPENILFVGFKNEKLKPLTGKTLAQVAKMRGTSPIETAMDLVIEDGSRVDAVYFLMSEENVRKELRLPWVSFCSDAGSYAPEGVFLKSSTHPRAYGNFARLLGKYVRDEKIIPLEEAVRRLTSQPAENLKLKDRGALKDGYFADVVVFDPATIQDHATFEKPQQYSTGVVHVFVNGKQVLKNGEHTGAKPGRFIRGPGWKK
ncbi:MAG: N-acyl-D-amino-acid deacylase [Verrucomicrobiales bacterium]|nr:N-acyl-D-amino-acid deacylase [Verrucomicrobiales bacterium]